MQQPSAQGIASLYRGNPQPLQQSIQKDQQAKPGLPPDLQKMLALQIVTNEEDSATAQKAMDQLRQMGGQSGKPPTVMASLQQQAEQKLQAQAVQAQQKQQGIQALMQQVPASGVPEGTPQPEMQPEAQGIDQLPAEFEMAEGGIVSFQSRGEVPTPSGAPLDERAQRALEEAQRSGDRDAMLMTLKKLGAAGYDIATLIPRAVMGVTEDVANTRLGRALGVDFQLPQAAYGGDRASMTPMSDRVARGPAARKEPAPAAPAEVENQSAAETARLQRQKSLPQAPAPAPAKDLKALAAQKIVAPAPTPAPVVEEAPAPAAQSDAQKMLTGRLNASPEASRAADVAEYERMVGRPDTAQHDRLIAELERRKQELAPKQGFEGLMEYLGQISANTQPGRGSFASGAAGARGVEALNKERAGQQFELSKQAIEVSQKKLDTVRAYAEKTYGIGKTAFDKVYKDQYDAAKELVKDEQEARKLAQENTLKRLQMQNNLAVQGLQNQGSLDAANARGAGAGVGDRQQLAELKALQTSLKDQLKDNRMMGKAGDPLRAQLAQVNMAIAQMAGLSTMGAAPGAAGPGGIPPDVQALLNKYGGK